MKEITSKFQVDTMTFVRVFPCEECDTKSCGMDEHKKHFEKDHKDMQYEHGCLFNSCEFKALLPEQLIKHFTDKHEKSITNILKKLQAKPQ